MQRQDSARRTSSAMRLMIVSLPTRRRRRRPLRASRARTPPAGPPAANRRGAAGDGARANHDHEARPRPGRGTTTERRSLFELHRHDISVHAHALLPEMGTLRRPACVAPAAAKSWLNAARCSICIPAEGYCCRSVRQRRAPSGGAVERGPASNPRFGATTNGPGTPRDSSSTIVATGVVLIDEGRPVSRSLPRMMMRLIC